MKYKIACLFFVLTTFLFGSATAQFSISSTPSNTNISDSVKPKSRLTIGGYGEAVYKYNFYSDNMFRYSHAEKYADAKGHGRVDLPHAVFMMSYDFGKGWTFNTDIGSVKPTSPNPCEVVLYILMKDGSIRRIYFYCVDISEFMVNKLMDRGSLTSRGIVTNAQDFIVNIANGLGL